MYVICVSWADEGEGRAFSNPIDWILKWSVSICGDFCQKNVFVNLEHWPKFTVTSQLHAHVLFLSMPNIIVDQM